jgi:hypothetical protein
MKFIIFIKLIKLLILNNYYIFIIFNLMMIVIIEIKNSILKIKFKVTKFIIIPIIFNLMFLIF